MSDLMTDERMYVEPTYAKPVPSLAVTSPDATLLGTGHALTPRSGLGADLRHRTRGDARTTAPITADGTAGVGIGSARTRSLFADVPTSNPIRPGSRSCRPPA